ncbi:MAG: ATP-binding protein [Desulfomonilaceae bacterium]
MDKRLLRTITKYVGKAIADFDLIHDRDRILVALSGGKDSWSLLYTLLVLRQRAPVAFDLAAATVHPGTPDFDSEAISTRLAREGVEHYVLGGNILDLVNEKLTHGTNPCSFCSRLRRGFLYTFAAANGWNKIALGHHQDDFVETLLLNLFFNGAIKGMSPNLLADDRRNRIIRPLVYVREETTRLFAGSLGVPILGCGCTYQGMVGSRRRWIKELLKQIEREAPDVKSNILHGMKRVHQRHLLSRDCAQTLAAPCTNDHIKIELASTRSE